MEAEGAKQSPDKVNQALEGDQMLSFGGMFKQQMINKEEKPSLHPENFNEILRLDVALNNYLMNNQGSLRPELQGMLDEPNQGKIPHYFDCFDVRRPVRKLVEEKFQAIIQSIFEGRKQVEKTLSRGELVAYDISVAKLLNPLKIHEKLMREVKREANVVFQTSQMWNQATLDNGSLSTQGMKHKNT
mmetsp:Transcript_8755/g.14852  ORF Transcript_8755/g.14852 Transcript_8755/m.14852 type:complete len:187 (+) Transcript_8755:2531-3091(+)